MSVVARWKTAKTTFETTTGKKKPSDKFLGLVRKGSGIEAALKVVDGAKDVAALRKALDKFNAAYTDHLKQLDKAAADPKTVPAADKAAYVAAIKALKTSLETIEADAAKMGEALQGAGKKEKVDSKALKEAMDHLALREKGVKESAALAAGFKASLAKVKASLANAQKQLAAARAAGKSGDALGHGVAVGVIDRYIEEIEAVAKATDKTYRANVTDGSSTFMKARLDPSTTGLPDSVLSGYLPKSKAAFAKMSQAVNEVNLLRQEIENAVDEVRALRAQAQGAGSQLKPSAAYVKDLTQLLAQIDKVNKDAHIKGDRIVKGNAQVPSIKAQAPDVQEKWYRLQEDQWNRYAPDMKLVKQRLTSLLAQAALPRGALEDAKVEKLVGEVKAAVKEGADYVDTVMLAGQQLLARIKLQRTQLG